jgi:cephalosporin hydroxylase
MINPIRKLIHRLRFFAREKCTQEAFYCSSKRLTWHKEWQVCSSAEDLFNFASTHIGIGQNKEEFLRFLEYIQGANPNTVMEIGVRDGGTSFMFANALKTCRIIIGLDIYLKNIHLLRSYRPKWIQKQEFICGDSSSDSAIKRVEKSLGSAKLDVLLIDGDHSLKGVTRDYYAYRTFVRNGGIIAFHDICMDHRRRYGMDTPNDSGEVYVFWQKIRGNYETKEFFTDEEQNGAGIGIILWDPSRFEEQDLSNSLT